MFSRRAPFFFLLFLVFSACSFAVSPKDVGRAEVDIAINWTISFYGSLPSEASFMAYGFPNNSNQRAVFSSSDAFSTSKDEFGNGVLQFNFSPSSSSKTINLRVRARTDFEPSNPFDDAVSGGSFLQDSAFVVSDAAVKTRADDLVSGAGDDFEKLVRLTEWVYNNVEYDKSAVFSIGASNALNSRQVLDIRRGVCKEFSHLLLGLLRSQKIPARYVVGFVYNGKEWGAHAWVEADVDGKWVPADPTFGEAGVLDASHVVMAYGQDQNDTKLLLFTSGTDLGQATIATASSAEFVSAENFSSFYGLDLEYPEEVRGPGSKETIQARVSSNAARAVAVPLSLNVNPDFGFAVLAPAERLVYLKPGEEATVSWPIIYPSALEPNLVYGYPMTLRSLAAERGFSLNASESAEKNSFEGAEITDFSASVGGGVLTLSLLVSNTGTSVLQDVPAMLSTETGATQNQSFSIAPGQSSELFFSVPVESFQEDVRATLFLFLPGGVSENQLKIVVATPTPAPQEQAGAPAPFLFGASVQIPSVSVPPAAGEIDYKIIAVFAVAALFAALFMVFVSKKPASEYQEI